MNLFVLGTKLYNCQRWINYRCVLVFAVRCLLHKKDTDALYVFLQKNDLRKEFLKVHPQVFAQLTRHFFFRASKVAERLDIICSTFDVLERHFREETLNNIYLDETKPQTILKIPYQDTEMALVLFFRNGEIREGAMTLALTLRGNFVYHVNFWILVNKAQEKVLYIGCHQGSKDGLAMNKELTKCFFGYRPKNFILFALRNLAEELEVQQMKAVSNYGFYANNHYRKDRKLKTSYDDFWQECGGEESATDKRFFDIPMQEQRKTMEQVPTRKRATYRKRFEFLDGITKAMQENFLQLRR